MAKRVVCRSDVPEAGGSAERALSQIPTLHADLP